MIDPTRLYSALLNSGLQNKDPALYQVIYQLIGAISKLKLETLGSSSSSSSSIRNSTYITGNNETGSLPNSRQLLAGLGISFDDTVVGRRTINSSGGSYWAPLTDGDLDETDLIFADGECIMVNVPS